MSTDDRAAHTPPSEPATGIPPGPCWHDSGVTWPDGQRPRCELLAGHAGAHTWKRPDGSEAIWTETAPPSSSDADRDGLSAIFTDRDREVSRTRAALLLALARADGQVWESIAEATPHTAEMMYGKQADAVEQLWAARAEPEGKTRVEWGHAHADEPEVVVVTSEASARAAVDGWNSARGSDGKGVLMRRHVGEWTEVEETQP